jgi:predicted transcriptional regulator
MAFKPGYSTTIILEIIIEAGQKGITIKNLQAKARKAYEAGNFGRSKLPEERVKHMMPEYIKLGLVEKDGDFYKATPALFRFMENLDN